MKPANPTPANTGSTRWFQRDTEREIIKGPVVLRGSAAGRCHSIQMCDQSTACNPDALSKLFTREGGGGYGKVKVKVNEWGHGAATVGLPDVDHQMLNIILI